MPDIPTWREALRAGADIAPGAWHTCGCGQWIHDRLAPCSVCRARESVMPAGPRVCSQWELTGKMRVRSGWRGCLVIQVEESQHHGVMRPDGPVWSDHADVRWRDARVVDVAGLPPGVL